MIVIMGGRCEGTKSSPLSHQFHRPKEIVVHYFIHPSIDFWAEGNNIIITFTATKRRVRETICHFARTNPPSHIPSSEYEAEKYNTGKKRWKIEPSTNDFFISLSLFFRGWFSILGSKLSLFSRPSRSMDLLCTKTAETNNLDRKLKAVNLGNKI